MRGYVIGWVTDDSSRGSTVHPPICCCRQPAAAHQMPSLVSRGRLGRGNWSLQAPRLSALMLGSKCTPALRRVHTLPQGTPPRCCMYLEGLQGHTSSSRSGCSKAVQEVQEDLQVKRFCKGFESGGLPATGVRASIPLSSLWHSANPFLPMKADSESLWMWKFTTCHCWHHLGAGLLPAPCQDTVGHRGLCPKLLAAYAN